MRKTAIRFRHSLAALLAALMLFSLLPVSALADEAAAEPASASAAISEPEPEPAPEPAPAAESEPETEPDPAPDTTPEPTVEPVPEDLPSFFPEVGGETEEPAGLLGLIEEVTDPDADSTSAPEEPEEEEEDDEEVEWIVVDYISDTWEQTENMWTVYLFLTEELGLNAAAACGVMANIQHESGFNPWAVGDYGTSYGLCQWHANRYYALREFCFAYGYAPSSIEGQLRFLQYELYTGFAGVYGRLLGAENTASGAYGAAFSFCVDYEAPESRYSIGRYRGTLAVNLFWPVFNVLRVTFDANGGLFDGEYGLPAGADTRAEAEPADVTAVEMSFVPGEAFGEMPEPTRRFYVFSGWFTTPDDILDVTDGDGEEFVVGVRISADATADHAGELTLYARWEHDAPNEGSVIRTDGTTSVEDMITIGLPRPDNLLAAVAAAADTAAAVDAADIAAADTAADAADIAAADTAADAADIAAASAKAAAVVAAKAADAAVADAADTAAATAAVAPAIA